MEALARDRAAELRDRELAVRDAARADDRRLVTGAEVAMRVAENRKAAAADRAAAAEARARAAADREQAARDREQAARHRVQAQADRDALLNQLSIGETDQLTAARTRAAGLTELDHEIERARRTAAELVIAYVDVVGLKTDNDARGRGAGDTLLRYAVDAIRDHLRAYDLIVRLGGDEFLCVMSGATIGDACPRFAAIHAALAAPPDPCEIKVGLAALAEGDSVAEIIDRAETGLRTAHRGRS